MLAHLRDYVDQLPKSDREWSICLRSPGRINIIGEHLDYNGGLVMPASIDKGIDFVVRLTDSPSLRLHAVDLGERHEVPLPITTTTGTLWVDYLAGIAVQYQDQGHLLPGLEIVFGGNVPRGSGMSSSAALEGGMAFLLNEVLTAGLSRPQLAQLCQRSSNTFLDIPSGIMDQYASLNGLATGPIVLNCGTLEAEPVKQAIEDYVFVLVNSMVSHDLSDGAYAARVAQCRGALRAIQESFPEVTYLADATHEQIDRVGDRITATERKRATYVVAENLRVNAAILAMEAGSALELGKLLNLTHHGLSKGYEVSCAELDYLQATAVEFTGVAGARMMGGGFGGCTLNLVKTGQREAFVEHIKAAYVADYAIVPEIYRVQLAAGTHRI